MGLFIPQGATSCPIQPDPRRASRPHTQEQYDTPARRPLLLQPVEWGGAVGKFLRVADYLRILFAAVVGVLFLALGIWLLAAQIAPGPSTTIYGIILFGLLLLALAFWRYKRLR